MDEPDADESADQPEDGGEESKGLRSSEVAAETSMMDETSPVESIATACDRKSASHCQVDVRKSVGQKHS